MEPEQQNQPNQPTQPGKGYGKRPVWQWILLYLIIAIIVYGIIYLVFIHKGDTSGTGSGGSSLY